MSPSLRWRARGRLVALEFRKPRAQLISQSLVFDRALLVPLWHHSVFRPGCDSAIYQTRVKLIRLNLKPEELYFIGLLRHTAVFLSRMRKRLSPLGSSHVALANAERMLRRRVAQSCILVKWPRRGFVGNFPYSALGHHEIPS